MFIRYAFRVLAAFEGKREKAASFVSEFGCEPTPTADRQAYHAVRRELSKTAQAALEAFAEENSVRKSAVHAESSDLRRYYQLELEKKHFKAQQAKDRFWYLHALASANGIETPASIKAHELTWR